MVHRLRDSQNFLVTMAASVMFVARLAKAAIRSGIHSFVEEVDRVPFDSLGLGQLEKNEIK